MNKQIAISEETHQRVKEYCDRNGYKIKSWIDNVLKKELDLRTLKR